MCSTSEAVGEVSALRKPQATLSLHHFHHLHHLSPSSVVTTTISKLHVAVCFLRDRRAMQSLVAVELHEERARFLAEIPGKLNGPLEANV
jgi:hypothetical protein